MKQQLLLQSPLLTLPIIALGLFLAVYLAVLIRTYLRKPSAYDPIARRPLEDDWKEEDDGTR